MAINFSRVVERRSAAILVVASFFLLFSMLGKREVENRPEARTIVTAREMLDRGDWFLPTLNGEPRLEKPPLYYWLVMIAAKISGEVDTFSGRLPSAISGFLLVLLVWFWEPRKEAEPKRFGDGWLAAMVLLTSPLLFWTSRSSEIDVNFALLIACSMKFLFDSLERPREQSHGPLILAYIFAGLAFLNKGPFGILFPFLPLIFLGNGKRPGAWWSHLVGIAIFCLIAFPWFYLIMERLGRAESTFSREVVFKRFTTQATHKSSFIYYVPTIIGAMAPWSLLLPRALVLWWKRQAGPRGRYLFWAVAVNFVLLSAIPSKQDHYLLPILAPCAVLIGWSLGVREAWLKPGLFWPDRIGWRKVATTVALLECLIVPALITVGNVRNTGDENIQKIIALAKERAEPLVAFKEIDPTVLCGIGHTIPVLPDQNELRKYSEESHKGLLIVDGRDIKPPIPEFLTRPEIFYDEKGEVDLTLYDIEPTTPTVGAGLSK
ncbi:MAG: glycosyltransferase family 39 protein [bacterium]